MILSAMNVWWLCVAIHLTLFDRLSILFRDPPSVDAIRYCAFTRRSINGTDAAGHAIDPSYFEIDRAASLRPSDKAWIASWASRTQPVREQRRLEAGKEISRFPRQCDA